MEIGTDTNTARILVVDDAPNTVEVIRRHLAKHDFVVYTAAGTGEATSFLSDTPVDLVITDMKMPGQTGMDLVRHVHDNFPLTQVIMVTGYATVKGAVDAVKAGADGYLAKPFTHDELLEVVSNALERLGRRLSTEGNADDVAESIPGIIGVSPPMKKLAKLIERVAPTSATVLISGESGTGKELVARALHYLSERKECPFVAVNCGAIPSELQESELFGHERGAFTGAAQARHGYFETADTGTIFLDEIGETSAVLQVKLLRVLQDHHIVRVGSSTPQPVNVRVVAATNQDIELLVRQGLFREDLYYRLNVVALTVPPLRERDEDVLLLSKHFIQRFARESDRPIPRLDDRAIIALRRYAWPGNVRELENTIRRMIILSDGETIHTADLPQSMRYSTTRETNLDRTLKEVELDYIRRVLDSVDGNKSETARILGIDRKTLREKLRQIVPDQ